MLRINCPYCGLRDQIEFRCGGEAGVVRPASPSSVSDSEWADYQYYRDNARGVHLERWVHSFGCRQWFLAERDTLSHEILATWRLDEGDRRRDNAREGA